ncbi:hypothetical protein SPRG_15357 [Saprolegnia parasitica CBS 223.65]|uniref:Golgi apparatus membrane protein TVP15 n=1 Tax=Saprolegnia parasitica (strain CBS 223.65) TaxID=695850 RepID=A0A067BXY9_SAPPC|nr:hypothetical protein SPRG_15357 [Saprolegnia parasitica CBS 223.65]KDO19452.1 hypothetical protein SPRG_15357 [Saprolegnia parasitica CBS 223.65]|eukprot:XP_012209835.1 hypothetical protein SPRG_15357 [Saprolegnia parasitica CBS 223.65]
MSSSGKPMGSVSSTPPSSATPPKSVIQHVRDIKEMETPRLLRYMRVGNILCAILQIFAGIGGIASIITFNLTAVFVSVYIIMFGVLFLLFECRLSRFEKTLRTNFGFLYSYKGRAFFIFFIGFMDFGTDDGLGYIAGIIMCINAFLNFYAMMRHPEFKNGNLSSSSDPTVGYAAAHKEAQNFISNNPNIAMQATNYAFSQANAAAPSYGSQS